MYLTIYLLNIFDLICTTYLVSKYGLDIEANPIGRILLKSTALVIFYKVFIVAGSLYVMYKNSSNKLTVVLSWAVLFVYAALLLYHLIVIANLHYILFIK